MERGITADQLMAALWRRKALVGAIAAGVLVVGAAVVASMPSVYTASTVVRVEPQRPQPELIQRTVSEQIEDRLLTVRQELLAEPVLKRAITELNLYPDIVSKKGVDAAVETMRKDIDVKVEGPNAFAFELSYSAQDPETAAKVANLLPQLYADEALRVRRDQAARATGLFADEVKVLKASIAEWEKKITQFKLAHMGELPELMEANMRSLERVSTQLNTKSEELRALEARRSDLARSHYAGDTEAGRLATEESELTTQLVDAKAEWTDEHPEVQRLKKDLAQIKAKRLDAESRMVAEKQERARVAMLITNVQDEIAALHNQGDAFQKRLDNTPRWAEELSAMQNDYDITKAKYQSVISRKVEAELAQDLEARGAKSLFNVVSPATAPTAPAKPDRASAMLIVALLALGLGVLTAIILEMRDDSLKDGSEIKARLPIPVLAVIPNIQTGKTEKRVALPTTKNTVVQSPLN